MVVAEFLHIKAYELLKGDLLLPRRDTVVAWQYTLKTNTLRLRLKSGITIVKHGDTLVRALRRYGKRRPTPPPTNAPDLSPGPFSV